MVWDPGNFDLLAFLFFGLCLWKVLHEGMGMLREC